MKDWNELWWLSIIIYTSNNKCHQLNKEVTNYLCKFFFIFQFCFFFLLFVIGGTSADPLPNVTLITPRKPSEKGDSGH